MVMKRQPCLLVTSCYKVIATQLDSHCRRFQRGETNRNNVVLPSVMFNKLLIEIRKVCQLPCTATELAISSFFTWNMARCLDLSSLCVYHQMVPSWDMVTDLNLSEAKLTRNSLIQIIKQAGNNIRKINLLEVKVLKSDLDDIGRTEHQLQGVWDRRMFSNGVDKVVMIALSENCRNITELKLTLHDQISFGSFLEVKRRKVETIDWGVFDILTTIVLKYESSCFRKSQMRKKAFFQENYAVALETEILESFVNLTELTSSHALQTISTLCDSRCANSRAFRLRRLGGYRADNHINWSPDRKAKFLRLFPHLTHIILNPAMLELSGELGNLLDISYYDMNRNWFSPERSVFERTVRSDIGSLITSVVCLCDVVVDILIYCPNVTRMELCMDIPNDGERQKLYDQLIAVNQRVYSTKLNTVYLSMIDSEHPVYLFFWEIILRISGDLREAELWSCGDVTEFVRVMVDCNNQCLDRLVLSNCQVGGKNLLELCNEDERLPRLKIVEMKSTSLSDGLQAEVVEACHGWRHLYDFEIVFKALFTRQ